MPPRKRKHPPAVISEEERARRSEVARRLHQETVIDEETGEERKKFGGKQPGGGKRKQRAGTIVADAARENAAKIKSALLAGISEDAPVAVRVSTAAKWLELEAREEHVALEEDRMLEGLRRDQLVSELAERLGALIDRGAIPMGAIQIEAVGELEAGTDD